jgi:hypothetical protein
MIAMLHHIGSGPRITLDGSYHVQKSGSGVTSVSIKLEADGDIVSNGAAGVVDEGDWIAPKEAAGGDWEARMVTVSGTLGCGNDGKFFRHARDWSRWHVHRARELRRHLRSGAHVNGR